MLEVKDIETGFAGHFFNAEAGSYAAERREITFNVELGTYYFPLRSAAKLSASALYFFCVPLLLVPSAVKTGGRRPATPHSFAPLKKCSYF